MKANGLKALLKRITTASGIGIDCALAYGMTDINTGIEAITPNACAGFAKWLRNTKASFFTDASSAEVFSRVLLLINVTVAHNAGRNNLGVIAI